MECLQQILAIDASAKVIIASGYSADDHLDHVLEKGAKRLLRKPYEARPMLELIRRVLDEPQRSTVDFRVLGSSTAILDCGTVWSESGEVGVVSVEDGVNDAGMKI